MKIGIALGGGGAKGFALIGILEALEEAGIRCEVVSGTSIGSLVGAAYAANRLPQLKAAAIELGLWRVIRILSPTISRKGFCSGRGVETFLREILPTKKIEDLPLQFATLSTALESGELICKSEGDLIKAIRSSISIPGLFTPVISGEKTLVDGGLIDPVPVEACRKLGADFVIAIDLFADLPPRKKPGFRLFSLLENCVGIVQRQLTLARYFSHPADFVLEPDTSSVSILAFHRGEQLIELGKSTMQKALPALQRELEQKAE